jgi:hypothetical protein
MAQLEILHPVAEILPASVPAAHRPNALDGATVGLFWNSKAGRDAGSSDDRSRESQHPGGATSRAFPRAFPLDSPWARL